MITASMLYSHMTCPHRVFLDCFGNPAGRDAPSAFLELLWERGDAFEAETVRTLGLPFLNLRDAVSSEREELTSGAMASDTALIYGGRISAGNLLGEPDLLRWTPSGYVPGDIKSGSGLQGASEDAAGRRKIHYAVQLAMYADILERTGCGSSRKSFILDIHHEETTYDLTQPRGPRTGATMWDEYKAALGAVEAIAAGKSQTRPGLVGECKLCHWHTHCRAELVRADDLTLIPEIGQSTRAKFPPEIQTVQALADIALEHLVAGGNSMISGVGASVLERYHARAVLQKQASPRPYFTEDVALPRSQSELFFDIETDPFRDLCYLHGFVERRGGARATEQYVPFFADKPTREAERNAFAEAWVYLQQRDDSLVYYYSPYEKTVWKQLAQRYPEVASATEVAALFDHERFIDLYTDVVRQRMVWPTHSLSVKALASFLGFTWRDTDPSGTASIQWFHTWLETGDPAVRQRILEYNEDDCRATRVLLDGIRRAGGSAQP